MLLRCPCARNCLQNYIVTYFADDAVFFCPLAASRAFVRFCLANTNANIYKHKHTHTHIKTSSSTDTHTNTIRPPSQPLIVRFKCAEFLPNRDLPLYAPLVARPYGHMIHMRVYVMLFVREVYMCSVCMVYLCMLLCGRLVWLMRLHLWL